MNSQRMNVLSNERNISPDDYPLLAVLSLGSAHGYNVWRHLKDNLGGIWNVGRSKVYAQLAQLERSGMVHHERVEQENLPARKVFSLTADSQKLVDEWMHTPVEHVRDFRLQFPAKLYFSGVRSSEVVTDLVQRQITVCRMKRENMQSQTTRCLTDIEKRVLDYRIGMIDTTLEWLEGLLKNT